MRLCENRCHNSMHSYVNIVSKSVFNGSNVLFLGVLSNHVVTGWDAEEAVEKAREEVAALIGASAKVR